MKNKIIISSILTIAMCVSLIAGSTFALFTSEDSVNIAVTSGKIEVVAKVDEATLATSSLGVAQTAGAFANGGSATLSGDTLKLDKLTPGDKATFSITVENKSNVAMNYRFVWSVAGELAPYLTATVNGNALTNNSTAWALWDTANGNTQTFAVVVELLDSVGNDAQGKAADISFKVEAVQGNTVPVESYNELLNNYYYQDGNYTFEEDIETDNPICFAENTTNVVNLQGDLTTKSTNMPALMSQSGSDLTINADNDTVIDCTSIGSQFAVYAGSNGVATLNGGTYKFGETTSTASIYSQNSATVVINDGVYISEDTNSPILYCINGYIEINGGFFQNTANPKQALISCGNNLAYVNNQKVTLSGGTFVNWNPMSSAYAQAWTNPTVPAIIVLADGYQMISETQANGDVWYMVVPVSE